MKNVYEGGLERLHFELMTMQRWINSTGARVIVILDERDAAGRGSSIKRVMQFLDLRTARVCALPQPSESEKSRWHLQ